MGFDLVGFRLVHSPKILKDFEMLTRKQQELLLLIHEKLQEEGIPPSFEEMKVALSLKSKSGIHRLITALEERGFIRRLPNRARALEVLRLPEGYAERAAGLEETKQSGFTPSVIEGGMQKQNHETEQPRGGLAARYGSSNSVHHLSSIDGGAANSSNDNQEGVPVMGRIAAGVPIAAIQEVSHVVAVPPSMIGPGSHFALEVQGDSMIEAGILNGDTVVIREGSSADLGDIVVALVDDEEATLKKFRKDGSKIALEAANPAYETRVLSADRVKVQGKLVGLIREY